MATSAENRRLERFYKQHTAVDNTLAPIVAAGDCAYVDPDEPAAHGRIVAVRADGPGGATLVRLLAVESGRSACGRRTPPSPAWR